MRSIDVYGFYSLGAELAAIKELPQDARAFQLVFLSYRAKPLLEALLGGIMVDLGVARGPASELLRILTDVEAQYCFKDGEWNLPDGDVKAAAWEVSKIKEALLRFEHVLAAETKTSAVYHATKKGIFNTQDLVEFGNLSFPDTIRSFITKQALAEYQFAGRALAFDLATAAAFHVSRAVEAVLKEYRACFLTSKPGKTMGAMLRTLQAFAEKKPALCPSEKTMRQVEQFVRLDRNRIMHPEDVLDADQALICFYNGISAITAMATEIKAIKGNPDQGVLPIGGLSQLMIAVGRQAEAQPQKLEGEGE